MSQQDLERLSNALHMTLPAADHSEKAQIRAQIDRVQAAQKRKTRPVTNLADRRRSKNLAVARGAAIELAKWNEGLHPRTPAGQSGGGRFVSIRGVLGRRGAHSRMKVGRTNSLQHAAAPVPGSVQRLRGETPEQFAASLSAYMESHSAEFTAGSQVSVRRRRATVVVARVATAGALAASLAGYGGGILGDETAPHDPGPTRNELAEGLNRAGRDPNRLFLEDTPFQYGEGQIYRRSAR
jgi:hypothetical protein